MRVLPGVRKTGLGVLSSSRLFMLCGVVVFFSVVGQPIFADTVIVREGLISASSRQTHSQIDKDNKFSYEQFYQQWRGAPYRLGGASIRGVDCSALVVALYRQIYAYSLPRTTKGQSKLGKKVRVKRLKRGDLVFFKTGLFQRHVGVYLSDNKFIHASSSKGVMTSSLKSPYWRSAYWTARRVL